MPRQCDAVEGEGLVLRMENQVSLVTIGRNESFACTLCVGQLGQVRHVDVLGQPRDQRMVDRGSISLFSDRFPFGHRQRGAVVVGNEPDQGKMVGFVGRLPQRNEDAVRQCQRNEDRQNDQQRPMVPDCSVPGTAHSHAPSMKHNRIVWRTALDVKA